MILRRRTIPKRKKVIIMFDTRKFGSFLADLRKSADMTQSELGDRLNLTRQAISRYECGDSFPDISVLGDIARIFGVPVELLISSGDPTVGEAGIINAVASGRDINPQDVSDVVSLAPLLKPSVLSKLAESLSKNGLDLSGLLSLSEYMNDTDTEKLMKSVSFDSIAEMDEALLERVLPLIPYSNNTIFRKILDGELDEHYLSYLDIAGSLVEAAVIYDALTPEALDITRRRGYNVALFQKRGIIHLFSCPECGKPLDEFYPRRCKCAFKPPITGNILRMTVSGKARRLNRDMTDHSLIPADSEDQTILILGARLDRNFIDRYYDLDILKNRFIVLDSDPERLDEVSRRNHSKLYPGLIFVQDDMTSPHILPGVLDIIIDNTEECLADSLRDLLKPGGGIIRGSAIL